MHPSVNETPPLTYYHNYLAIKEDPSYSYVKKAVEFLADFLGNAEYQF